MTDTRHCLTWPTITPPFLGRSVLHDALLPGKQDCVCRYCNVGVRKVEFACFVFFRKGLVCFFQGMKYSRVITT